MGMDNSHDQCKLCAYKGTIYCIISKLNPEVPDNCGRKLIITDNTKADNNDKIPSIDNNTFNIQLKALLKQNMSLDYSTVHILLEETFRVLLGLPANELPLTISTDIDTIYKYISNMSTLTKLNTRY